MLPFSKKFCRQRLTSILIVTICLHAILSFRGLSVSVDIAYYQELRQLPSPTLSLEKEIKSSLNGFVDQRIVDDIGNQRLRQRQDQKPLQKPRKQQEEQTAGTSAVSSPCNNHHVVYDQIEVSNSTKKIKILCFVMTHSNSHSTRIKAVRETWGKRCDKLLIASNTTDKTWDTIEMKAPATHLGLWTKLNETMQYIYENHRNEGYDWIFKADDDSYVIVENLRNYLTSDVVTKKNTGKSTGPPQPLIHGRRYSSPRYRNLAKREVYFGSPRNAEFGKRFYQKINKHKPVLYNYGGSGYAMNWQYAEKFCEVNKGPDTVHGNPPEDQANGVVMGYHGVWAQNTRDRLKREQFHQESPEFMYGMNATFQKLWNENHKSTGGISVWEECCSTNSITFHHIHPPKMYQMHHIFYACRKNNS